MNNFKIFIVEDDPWYGEVLKYHLSLNEDFEVFLFSNAKDCLEKLYLKPNVVSIDFNLPDMSGEDLMKRIKSQNPSIPIIFISAQEDISVVLSLLKKGAYEYIMKDDNTKEILWNSILRIKENVTLKQEVEELKVQLVEKYDFEKLIIGQSDAIKKSFVLIEKAIKNNINVSITGETGTGKELVAKSIHFNSDRRKKPFVAVNMSAIPRELMESELFGYEKGAFTGAAARRIGKFEEANGGTIFLDEIAEADLSIQSKLLRVLQEREIVRLGSNQNVKLDIRLITATHKNLKEEVRNGNFREDLYYRIIGLPIELPPLRERGNDILVLAKHFSDQFCKENKMTAMTFSKSAKELLLNYNFPGNIRELKAIVELACVMSDGVEIKSDDFTFVNNVNDKDTFDTKLEKSMDEYVADIVTIFLKKYNQNVVEVAHRLKIGKSTIYNMINSGKIEI
ncbi:MAG: sigma-54-dependent Fis family transcriptional regulator [Saprospiraceae bacterium]|nr:sigma-54-dependent Fis family transcriptional regulator [Saprospiraceae bacterium]